MEIDLKRQSSPQLLTHGSARVVVAPTPALRWTKQDGFVKNAALGLVSYDDDLVAVVVDEAMVSGH